MLKKTRKQVYESLTSKGRTICWNVAHLSRVLQSSRSLETDDCRVNLCIYTGFFGRVIELRQVFTRLQSLLCVSIATKSWMVDRGSAEVGFDWPVPSRSFAAASHDDLAAALTCATSTAARIHASWRASTTTSNTGKSCIAVLCFLISQ